MVWDSVLPNTGDIRKTTTKARLSTGTYIFQLQKSKFSKKNVDPICPMCQLEEEDIAHFLTRCPALEEIRSNSFQFVRRTVIDSVGIDIWNGHFQNRSVIVQLLLDSQQLVLGKILPENKELLYELERQARDFCYKLHTKRLSILGN